MTNELIARLRRGIRGQLITPDDPEYDDARTVFPGDVDREPAVIARPADAGEVAQVIAAARDSGLPLAVRSGGHGPGHSVCDDGIVLDLKHLKEFSVDDGAAWAQTGLTAGEYTAAAARSGHATGFGDTGSVGIGGITLGGGMGFLSRRNGLTIDDLLGAEIVTADGELLQVDDDHHPELFWAIRGGGGNFGVATRFRFRLHELSTVHGGMMILPASPDTLAGFVAEAHAAPDELTAIVNVTLAPPAPFLPEEAHGRLIMMALMCYSGRPDDGERVLAPFRALATPITDSIGPISYGELFGPNEPDFHPTAVGRTTYLDSVTTESAGDVLGLIESCDAPMRMVQFRVLGGAIARIAPGSTAYAHRTAGVLANVNAFYTSTEDKSAREAWVDEVTARLEGFGAYVNFLGADGAQHVRDAYPGETWQRLVDVKRQYDPTNLFRMNHNLAVG